MKVEIESEDLVQLQTEIVHLQRELHKLRMELNENTSAGDEQKGKWVASKVVKAILTKLFKEMGFDQHEEIYPLIQIHHPIQNLIGDDELPDDAWSVQWGVELTEEAKNAFVRIGVNWSKLKNQ